MEYSQHIYLFHSWFKNRVMCKGRMAHSFRMSMWPAGHPVVLADAAAGACFGYSTCFASCSLLVTANFAWLPSNSWAALWAIICRTRTPRLETDQKSHAFSLTFGKTFDPSLERIATSTVLAQRTHSPIRLIQTNRAWIMRVEGLEWHASNMKLTSHWGFI